MMVTGKASYKAMATLLVLALSVEMRGPILKQAERPVKAHTSSLYQGKGMRRQRCHCMKQGEGKDGRAGKLFNRKSLSILQSYE